MSFNRQHTCLASIFYGFCFLIAVKSYFDYVLLHQLHTPVIWDGGVDLLTYLGLTSGVFKSITGNQWLCYSFDTALLILPLVLVFQPQRRLLAMLNFSIWLVYFLIYNLYGTHQTHALTGLLLVHIPFLFYQKPSFHWLWNGVRYYTLWIMSSAAAWKIIRGTAFHPQQGKNIYLQNQTGAIIESGITPLQSFLLSNEWLLNLSFPLGVILEGLFMVGFFTKRFDRLLVILLILLIAGFRLLADATFFELLILVLPLWYSERVSKTSAPA
jgi:hypothetical protein